MSDRDLPPDFVQSGLEIADGAYLFGKRLTDCTREELIAAAAHGWASERQVREDGQRRTAFLLSLIRR